MTKKRVILISIGAVLLVSILHNIFPFGKPVLRVTTQTAGSGTWISFFGGKRVQYTVYSNGAKRKRWFNQSKVEEYSLYRLNEPGVNNDELLSKNNIELMGKDNEDPYISYLNEISYKAAELVDMRSDLKRPYTIRLYVLDGRYFFNVFAGSFSDIIFEYIPEDNRIIEIAWFYGEYIQHIELY